MDKIIRKCVSCAKVHDREFMYKITYSKNDKKLYLNPSSKIVGHSIYVCPNSSCIKDCIKKKKIQKLFFKYNVLNIEDIEKELSEINEK